jgi:hypothetical protein
VLVNDSRSGSSCRWPARRSSLHGQRQTRTTQFPRESPADWPERGEKMTPTAEPRLAQDWTQAGDDSPEEFEVSQVSESGIQSGPAVAELITAFQFRAFVIVRHIADRSTVLSAVRSGSPATTRRLRRSPSPPPGRLPWRHHGSPGPQPQCPPPATGPLPARQLPRRSRPGPE